MQISVIIKFREFIFHNHSYRNQKEDKVKFDPKQQEQVRG